MSACDWRPYAVEGFLRQAREAATRTADWELRATAVQTVVTEIETLRSLSEGDPNHGEHLRCAIERIAWAGEHLARHAAMEDDGDDVPH